MRGAPSLIAVITVIAGSLIACGSEDACDLPRQEAPYPASGVHLLDDTNVVWPSDLPTSGPHRALRPPGGIHHEPIPRLDQVAFLESGGVVLHYSSSLTPRQIAQLQSLAGATVAIAPNPVLGTGTPVAATAWTWRLLCRTVELEVLDRFVNRHADTGGVPH